MRGLMFLLISKIFNHELDYNCNNDDDDDDDDDDNDKINVWGVISFLNFQCPNCYLKVW